MSKAKLQDGSTLLSALQEPLMSAPINANQLIYLYDKLFKSNEI